MGALSHASRTSFRSGVALGTWPHYAGVCEQKLASGEEDTQGDQLSEHAAGLQGKRLDERTDFFAEDSLAIVHTKIENMWALTQG